MIYIRFIYTIKLQLQVCIWYNKIASFQPLALTKISFSGLRCGWMMVGTASSFSIRRRLRPLLHFSKFENWSPEKWRQQTKDLSFHEKLSERERWTNFRQSLNCRADGRCRGTVDLLQPPTTQRLIVMVDKNVNDKRIKYDNTACEEISWIFEWWKKFWTDALSLPVNTRRAESSYERSVCFCFARGYYG